MKKIKQLLLSGLVLAFVLSSCSVEKGVYLSGYHLQWNNKVHNANKKQLAENTKNNEIFAAQTSEVTSTENPGVNEAVPVASTDNSIYIPASPKIEWNKKNTTTSSKSTTASAETKKITKAQKKKQNRNAPHPNLGVKKFHWAAITGFVTGLVGLLIAGLPLGICAIVFSTIALVKIANNPEEYRGLGLAIAGLILGILDVVIIVIFLSLIL